MVVALVLIFWPGASDFVLWAFVKVFGRYDDSMFRARDVARDETQPRWKRNTSKVRHMVMLGIPLAIVFAVMLFAEFGEFLTPLFRAMFGRP
jgi:hypothetical protein